MPSLVFLGPPKIDRIATFVRAAPAGRCVDRAASQRARRTATTPSLTSRRCAPSPCAMPAPSPRSAPPTGRRSSSSTVPMLWERPSGSLCVGGGCAAAAAHRAVAAATFLAEWKVCRSPQALNSCPTSLIPPVAATHGCSLRAHRYLYERRGAHLRRRPDHPHPRRGPCHRCRHRRPRSGLAVAGMPARESRPGPLRLAGCVAVATTDAWRPRRGALPVGAGRAVAWGHVAAEMDRVDPC